MTRARRLGLNNLRRAAPFIFTLSPQDSVFENTLMGGPSQLSVNGVGSTGRRNLST
jgi:hypothetical protein